MMKLISRKCGICLSWYRPQAHSNHCPVCGCFPIPLGHKTVYYDGARLGNKIPMVSVSARMIPSVFFHSDSHGQMLTLRQKKV